MSTPTFEAYVAAQLEKAPKLTGHQRTKLAELLRPVRVRGNVEAAL